MNTVTYWTIFFTFTYLGGLVFLAFNEDVPTTIRNFIPIVGAALLALAIIIEVYLSSRNKE